MTNHDLTIHISISCGLGATDTFLDAMQLNMNRAGGCLAPPPPNPTPWGRAPYFNDSTGK